MTIDATRLRELCAKGLNAQQIATRLGVTPNAVYQRAKRLGISVAAVEGYESRASSFVAPAMRAIESCGTQAKST